jgi:peptidoglycan/xylan/chitin deacetylase (PgdA/CDA1 family)
MGSAGANFFAAAISAAVGLAGTICAVAPAHAQSCPGNPNALGTSRVLAIDPAEYSRVGTMQYPQTLPLEDHEVVLTFDDGPLPPNSNKILDILASQCVKATYFLIGRMAQEFPDVVRRIHAEGHTIGTHSQNHPINIRKLPDERVRQEIEDGIASVGAALGDPAALAPFFRIPGLERSDIIDSELEAHGLIAFSADAVADDWHRHIKPAQIITRAMSRLEAKGRGILLLHDIHPWTAVALPGLLNELKAHGFRVVQVVPAPGVPSIMIAESPELTVAWSMARQEAIDDGDVAPFWPARNARPISHRIALAAPAKNTFEATYPLASPLIVADADAELPSTMALIWPDVSEAPLPSSEALLPVLSLGDIGWPVQARPSAEQSDADLKLELRPSLDATGSISHGGYRQAHLGTHNSAPRHARAPAPAGQHAGLAAALAALFTPAK